MNDVTRASSLGLSPYQVHYDAVAYEFPEQLKKMGIQYEEWNVEENVSLRGFILEDGFKLKNPTPAHVLEVLHGNKDQEKRVYDFRTPEGSIDMVEFSSATPGIEAWLVKFDALHSHSAPEIRVILAGKGLFNVVTPDGEKITIPVQKGSFLLIPANVTHNFTLSENKLEENLSVTALRIFQDQDGWVSKPPTVQVKQM